MKARPAASGPWIHKLLVTTFSVLFGLLIYWLLGFVLRDIGTWPGPDYSKLEQELLDPRLVQTREELKSRLDESGRTIADQQQRQALLRDSTGNAEKIMNRLLELQRAAAQEDRKPAAAELQVLAESQRLFLTNQARYQEINERIATLTDQQRDLTAQQRTNQVELETRLVPVRAEYQRRMNWHQLKLAGLKLAFLLPILALAVWLFLKRRTGLYGPCIYGLGIATAIKVGWVIHDHFPRRYFKYVLWNRRALRNLTPATPNAPPADEPYVCPVCGTRMFEACADCGKIRHSLLPVCTHCGLEKPLLPAA